MRKRHIAVLAALSLTGAAPVAAAPAAPPQAQASHTCRAGYTHAHLPWGQKCLRRGQFCKRDRDRTYHRYGYHCHRSGHLS
ncbi:MAG TPA: hypothetical protein VNB64_06115 [Solirubrobacteraceae bacterium]|nr:hypothetical protein [Solirubrobacteraceae bacterium]